MSVLRKYPKLAPQKRRSIVTIDHTLLAAMAAAVVFGLAQTRLAEMASNDQPANPMLAALKPVADYTPVGSIEAPSKRPATREEAEAAAGAQSDNHYLAEFFGLRARR